MLRRALLLRCVEGVATSEVLSSSSSSSSPERRFLAGTVAAGILSDGPAESNRSELVAKVGPESGGLRSLRVRHVLKVLPFALFWFLSSAVH